MLFRSRLSVRVWFSPLLSCPDFQATFSIWLLPLRGPYSHRGSCGGGIEPENVLTINIDPDLGLDLRLNMKKVGQEFATKKTKIGYRLSKEQVAKIPEAYERLILNVLQGNAVNFTHWDELKYSWRFLDAIRNAWDEQELPVDFFPNYACGTMGPQEIGRAHV